MLFLKRQQWTITNHALVLYAAMVALAKGTNDIERTVLSFMALIGCGFTVYWMQHAHRSMGRILLQMPRERPDFHYNGAFIWGLITANVLAFLVSIYFIWVKGGLPERILNAL